MSSLVTENFGSPLSAESLEKILDQIQSKLRNRVVAAYVFGSASEGTVLPESDVDLILVLKNSQRPFVQRAFDFMDLYEIFPRLDILVYTPAELEAQLADSNVGFWKSVRLSMKRIV